MSAHPMMLLLSLTETTKDRHDEGSVDKLKPQSSRDKAGEFISRHFRVEAISIHNIEY